MCSPVCQRQCWGLVRWNWGKPCYLIYIICLGRNNTGRKSPIKKCQQELSPQSNFSLVFSGSWDLRFFRGQVCKVYQKHPATLMFNLPSNKVAGIITLCMSLQSYDLVEAIRADLYEGKEGWGWKGGGSSVFKWLLRALRPSHLLEIITSKLLCKTNSVYTFTFT